MLCTVTLKHRTNTYAYSVAIAPEHHDPAVNEADAVRAARAMFSRERHVAPHAADLWSVTQRKHAPRVPTLLNSDAMGAAVS